MQKDADTIASNLTSSRESKLVQFIAKRIEERVLAVGQVLGKKTQSSIKWNSEVIAKAIRHENPTIFLLNQESLGEIIDYFIALLDIKKCS